MLALIVVPYSASREICNF